VPTPSPPVDEQLLADAIEIAEAAATLTLGWFQGADLDVDTKADGSEVTAADRAAEEYVRSEVNERYPDDTVVGEEAGTTEGTSGGLSTPLTAPPRLYAGCRCTPRCWQLSIKTGPPLVS